MPEVMVSVPAVPSEVVSPKYVQLYVTVAVDGVGTARTTSPTLGYWLPVSDTLDVFTIFAALMVPVGCTVELAVFSA